MARSVPSLEVTRCRGLSIDSRNDIPDMVVFNCHRSPSHLSFVRVRSAEEQTRLGDSCKIDWLFVCLIDLIGLILVDYYDWMDLIG